MKRYAAILLSLVLAAFVLPSISWAPPGGAGFGFPTFYLDADNYYKPYDSTMGIAIGGTAITLDADGTAKFAGTVTVGNLVGGGSGSGDFMADGSVPMSGDLNMGAQALTNVGNVDGVDVSAHATSTSVHHTATVDTDTTYNAGDGVTLTGTTFSADASTNITVTSAGISVNTTTLEPALTAENLGNSGSTAGQVLATDGAGDTYWKADATGGGGANLFETVAGDAGTNPVADSTTDTLNITGGAGVTTTGDSSTDTIDITVDHDAIANFVAAEHIDWTADQGATNIHSGNYTDTDTTYNAGTGLSLAGTTFSYSGNFAGVSGSISDAQVPTDITIDARTIAQGGTSATTASGARTALGLAIGSDIQAYSANMDTDSTDDYTVGGTDVPVTDGGTGASSLADGFVLLGSGTAAITPLDLTTDGAMIVGDGTTDPVAESGATLRTSIGVAIGSDVQAYDATLDDLAAAPLTEAGSIGAGAYVAASIDGDDVNSNIAGRSLTLTAASPDTLDADVELYTDVAGIWFEDPTAADDFKSIWTANGFAATIIKIWCESDQTVNMDLQIDDGTPADVAGTDLVCDSTPAEDEAGLTGAMADGDRLDLVITSVSGTPTWVSIFWTYTKDD